MISKNCFKDEKNYANKFKSFLRYIAQPSKLFYSVDLTNKRKSKTLKSAVTERAFRNKR